jgi:hypothetical protein
VFRDREELAASADLAITTNIPAPVVREHRGYAEARAA